MKFLKFFSFLFAFCLCFLFQDICSSAAVSDDIISVPSDYQDYDYSISISGYYKTGSSSSNPDFTGDVYSSSIVSCDYPMFAYLNSGNYICTGVIIQSGDAIVDSDIGPINVKLTKDMSGSVVSGKVQTYFATGKETHNSYYKLRSESGFTLYTSLSYCNSDGSAGSYFTDGYLFESLDAAKAFYVDGNTDGLIHGPVQKSVERSDLYLTNVRLEKRNVADNFQGRWRVTWDGTSLDDELVDVPTSSTLIVPTVYVYDTRTLEGRVYNLYESDLVFLSPVDLDFSNHSISIYGDTFYQYYYNETDKSSLALTKIYLNPCYTVDGVLYTGMTTVIDFDKGTIGQQRVDPDSGEFVYDDITPDPVVPDPDFDFYDLSTYLSKFFKFLTGLVGAMGVFPSLFASVFSFLPSIYVNAIGVLFLIILLLRVLGR